MAKYRRDIEGLRAVAVSSILLFHFGYAALGGGYVGVDVFFVISGFLIGKSVIAQTLDGSFSLLGFFEQRVRRLYPALVVLLLICAVVAPLLLLPRDLLLFGKSLVATAAYASNMLFLKEAGYFDGGAILKPLLHTWSLAVEEQFYIGFPVLMMLLAWTRVSRRAMVWTVALLALASFAGAEAMMFRSPSAAFYLFPLRAWELLAGVLVGSAGWGWFADRRLARESVAALGLALIVGAILLYRPETRFPGIHALPPVLGAALVIAAGGAGPTAAGRLLGARPLGWIGRVSYSLYLWHWPLVVFLAYPRGGMPPEAWRLGGIAATVVLAALSYRFVEAPLRHGRGGRWAVLGAAAIASLLFAGAGFAFWKTNGLPGRYPVARRDLVAAADDFDQRRGVCFDRDNPTYPGLGYCRLGDPNRAADFLVWADSHGRAFRDGLDLAASEHGRAGILVWNGGCPPLMDVRKIESATSPAADADCFDQSSRLTALLARDRTWRDVLLIGRWAYYTQGGGVGADAANRIRLTPADGGASSGTIFAAALSRTVATLDAQGRRVFVLEQVPEVPAFSSRRLAQRVLAGHEPLAAVLSQIGSVDQAAVDQRQAVAQKALATLESTGRAVTLRTHARFCDGSRCAAWHGGMPYLFDNNHVRVAASLRLRDLFAPFFADTRPIDGR